MNRAGEKLFGLPREEAIGKTSAEIFEKEEADTITARDEELLASSTEISLQDHPVKMPRKGRRLVTTKKVTIRDNDGAARYFVNVIEDVTDRRQAEARIEYLANHDALTELPNRAAFTRQLEVVVERAEKSGEAFALIYVDLDRFREVNDIFGDAGGDRALCEMARRLQTAAEGALLARMGGDEFTLIVTGASAGDRRTLSRTSCSPRQMRKLKSKGRNSLSAPTRRGRDLPH